MSRTPAKKLREAVATQLFTYLSEGVLCDPAVAASIDPSDLDIDDLERLCRLRFVLSPDVVDFAGKISERLRRIRTSSRRTTETERGTVSGRIDWPETHSIRSRAGHADPTLYATDAQSVEYDIAENRVVKRLLSVIVDVVRDEFLNTDYDWQSEWSGDAVEELTRTFRENQYLSQLPDTDSYTVTTRDLDTARRSRHALYREAATLLQLYRDLLGGRYERSSVQELLRSTLITPSEPARLFELYSVFELLEALETNSLEYRPVEPETGAIAKLKSAESIIEVYHDETGPVTLSEPLPSLDSGTIPDPFSRDLAAMEAYNRHREAILGQGSERIYYSGRPDIVICVFDRVGSKRTLQGVTIGEVKYTRKRATLARGLRELSEYIHFAQVCDKYLTDTDRMLSGLVVTNCGGVIEQDNEIFHLGLSPPAGDLPVEDIVPYT